MREDKTTYLFRIVHVANLPVLLERRGLHAPNHQPNDGAVYRTIHDSSLQIQRHRERVPCGPRGVLHDYVPFYFGRRSPMLLRLHTGRVEGYVEGQRPILYLVSAVETIRSAELRFVFSDGHGLAHYTQWFDTLQDLEKLDWEAITAKYWSNHPDDNDRERRKQAEFLVH